MVKHRFDCIYYFFANIEFVFYFSEHALDIKEGDVFYALATFVSETGEAMNLVEGERVFVLEWNNQVMIRLN
jgi:hypothetical protein